MFYVLYDPVGSYCLIYWTDEESVSAVCAESIVQPSPSQMVVGDECEVKCGRRTHKGLLSATGKLAWLGFFFLCFFSPTLESLI